MKQVRFEDQIDVHLGDDETLEMYIYCSCTECTPELGNETMEHDQSPSSSTSPSDVHPPASAGDRQEAILFHLQDDPIRTFLE